jgi:hypothetical protein
MRFLTSIVAIAILAATPAFAQPVSAPGSIAQKSCDASYGALTPDEKSHLNYQDFIANCYDTRKTWEEPQNSSPDQSLSHVTGVCRDNSFTTAMTKASACLNDGGIATWFLGTAPAPKSQECVGSTCSPSTSVVTPKHSPPRRLHKMPMPRRLKHPETPST